MKQAVSIINWGHADPEIIEAVGFDRPNPKGDPMSHGAYFVEPEEMWLFVEALYNAGLNVQLLHTAERVTTILVDSGRFRQR